MFSTLLKYIYFVLRVAVFIGVCLSIRWEGLDKVLYWVAGVVTVGATFILLFQYEIMNRKLLYFKG